MEFNARRYHTIDVKSKIAMCARNFDATFSTRVQYVFSGGTRKEKTRRTIAIQLLYEKKLDT